MLAGGRLVDPDARLAMQDLPLQVGQINVVAVCQGEVSNAGRSKIECGRRAKSASADDQCVRIKQALLAFDTDIIQEDVATVAQQLLVVHGHTESEETCSLPVNTCGCVSVAGALGRERRVDDWSAFWGARRHRLLLPVSDWINRQQRAAIPPRKSSPDAGRGSGVRRSYLYSRHSGGVSSWSPCG